MILFCNLCGASICGTNRILFYSLGKLVHQNSATTLDSELVFVNSTWKNGDVEMAISVIFVMIKDSRKSRYLDVLTYAPPRGTSSSSSLSTTDCQMPNGFLHFDTLRVNLNINTKCSFCFFVMLIIVYKRNQ